ncbi:MAG: vanadium-dependent haloperoxidase [Candidatus Binatia bacterium]
MLTVALLLTLAIEGQLRLAQADAVTDWNEISTQAILTAGRSPLITSLDYAIVHAAIYDAAIAFDGRFEPYHVAIPNAAGSPIAAVATAAHEVLVALFPAQQAALDTVYLEYLTAHGVAAADAGVTVGEQTAAGILVLRANDGRFPPNYPPFTGGTDLGVWRPTPSYLPGPPPAFAPGAAPWVATVTPFTLESPSQFRADPPPRLTSARYRKDYNEVKAVGALDSTSRTPEQTELAYFWADNTAVLWNRAIQGLVTDGEMLLTLGESARLFALVNLAGADAAITCWDSKYTYVFWRPITAIQEGDNDGNPKTIGDPNWQPLINTPSFPEYTSGHVTYSGAVGRILKLFFKTDKVPFTVTSSNPLAEHKTRTYTRFSYAVEETIDARVYSGIHFRNSDVVGRDQGKKAANWTFKYFLRPVK